MPILPTIILILLAVPFDALWPDFEAARRGALLVAAGLLACTLPRTWPRPLPRGTLLLACFCLWHLVRTFDVTNSGEAWLRAQHLLALGIWFIWGATQKDLTHTLRAVLPATLIVSCYGLAQALGLRWPELYAQTGEAVSTLGNRNVASEFVCLGIAAAAALAVRGESRRLAAVTLLPCAAYLLVNGSRSGLIAGAIGIGLALAESRPENSRRRLLPLAAIALGTLLGFVIVAVQTPRAEPESTPRDQHTAVPTDAMRFGTIEVRRHIWQSAFAMFDAEPILGQGTGQFRYEYPRYRSAEEIELTTFGRRFHTFVDTAHNDYLEILVETGLPGLATLLCFLFVVLAPMLRRGKQMTTGNLSMLAVPAAFLALALVRSPLGNAPTAAFVFLVFGALARREPIAVKPHSSFPWLAVPAGILLVWNGLLLLGAEQSMANFGRSDELIDVQTAVRRQPSDSRWRSLQVQRQFYRENASAQASYAAVGPDLAVIGVIDPYNTTALLRRAEISKRAGDLATTQKALEDLLRLDPVNPEATLITTVMLVEAGVRQTQLASVGRGIATLYANPHLRLREKMALHLDNLLVVPRQHGDKRAELLIIRERDFIRALDAALDRVDSNHNEDAIATYQRSVSATDPRLRILTAYRLLARGATIDDIGGLVPVSERPPGRSVQRLMVAILTPLRENPAWQQFLTQE